MSPSKVLGIKKTSTNSGADRRTERIKRQSPSEWYVWYQWYNDGFMVGMETEEVN